MLKGLSISALSGDSLSLPIPSGGDGYLVTEIEGLDPVPVALVSSTYAQLDGERYHASRREKRNIVLHIKLQKNWWTTTVDTRRNRLYSLFVPNHEILLTFDTPLHGFLAINGRVESIDASMWTDEPMFVVSIICFDPIFRSSTPVTVTYDFTAVSSETTREIVYEGNISAGINISVVDWEVNATSANMILFMNKHGNNIEEQIHISGALAQWDRVSLSTVPNNKFVSKTIGDGTVSSILHMLDLTTMSWLQLGPGINLFKAWTDEPTSRKYSISYHNLYGGI